MQMIDGLPAIGAAVDDHAVTVLQAEFFGEIADHEPQMGDQRRVVIGKCIEIGDLLLRNHQHMRRRFWRNIAKRQAAIILVHNVGGNFTIDDAFENRLGHGRHGVW